MPISNSLLHVLNSAQATRVGHLALAIAACSIGSGITAELLGYWLHRLLHSGWIDFLSRNHMKHHMVIYGPLQKQRTPQYRDATDGRLSLGNIGLEWLVPAAVVMGIAVAAFHYFHVRPGYQLVSLGITLGWSFLMFSYLHDVMHVEGIWLERNRWLRCWFIAARRLHDIHHHGINDRGTMDKNFGIGFFLFDKIFGTFTAGIGKFNFGGFEAARCRFQSALDQEGFPGGDDQGIMPTSSDASKRRREIRRVR